MVRLAVHRHGNPGPNPVVKLFQIPPGRSRDDALSRVSLARAAVGDSAGAAQVVAQIASARARDLAQVKLAEYEARSGRAGSTETMLARFLDAWLMPPKAP